MSAEDSINPVYYPFSKDMFVPLNCKQADSLFVMKPKIEYTQSVFINNKLSIDSNIKLKTIDNSVPSWFFIYLLVTLLLTSIISQLYRKRFKTTMNAVWQNRYYNQISNESSIFDNSLNLLFFIMYSANISFIVVLYVYNYHSSVFESVNIYFSFLLLTISILLYSILKTASAVFTAKLFKQESFSTLYISHLHISENNIAVLLLPLLWLSLYHPGAIIFGLTAGIFLIFGSIRFVKLLYQLSISSRLSTYQIFLYLCTVEILPLIVLLKFLSTRI